MRSGLDITPIPSLTAKPRNTIGRVIVKCLATLLVVAAPFGTAVAAFMTIVWINLPGIYGMVIVYAVFMGLEAIALDFLTSPRRAWASPRTFLRVTFLLMAGIAPLVLLAYAFLMGTHG